ncbi:MAG: rRNA maturation RNase YbeY [Nitrosomonas sp.]|nr:rRNA maturation RNase YbeY [Nitrosomonas sp.]
MDKQLTLSVQYAIDAETIPTSAQFEKWVKAALTRNAEITIRIVDEFEGRDLNEKFRRKKAATNVLTFYYDDILPLTGDIVLCAAVIEKEAKQQHKTLIAHYAHLTVHGVLHLMGFDHENDKEAAAMEQIETTIVTNLGYNDPYQNKD